MDTDSDKFHDMDASEGVVVEEIYEDESMITGKLGMSGNSSNGMSPDRSDTAESDEELPVSPQKLKREFGNISPISELLDDDVADLDDLETETFGKESPEPTESLRKSFPKTRISGGRSSPILAYSPSLIKSPSSKSTVSNHLSTSPSSSGGSVGKRPRNIARMLDNISDHSSSEDDVNNVGAMMAKFTV